MEVSLQIYRAAIGLFNCRLYLISAIQVSFAFLLTMLGCLHCLILLVIFFLICTDVESNLGSYQNVA